jgi:t-SNARE complex subunit (syntaxin)
MDDPTLNVPEPTGPAKDPFREGPVAARARRMRSLGIALALVAFVVVVFVVSLIKLAAASHAGA